MCRQSRPRYETTGYSRTILIFADENGMVVLTDEVVLAIGLMEPKTERIVIKNVARAQAI